ncbi:MAG: GNAT family N-acetyltransferase [Aeoliella sp.]
MSDFELRLATASDLPAINDIYNHYVATSTTTYNYQPTTSEARSKWFQDRLEIHPVTVVTRREQVVAWGSLGPFRPQPGYRLTVENSVYVHPDHQRCGIGSILLTDQTERAQTLGLWAIVAVIDSEQVASIAIHRKFGFVEKGRLTRIARKFDRWLDAVLMQYEVDASGPPSL